MKAFFGKTVDMTKSLLTRITASDNYNPDALVVPVQTFATSSLETENLLQVVEKARRALIQCRDALKSESFQFKGRLLQDLLETGYILKLGGLSRERELTVVMEDMLWVSTEIMQAYPEELLFVKLCKVAVQFVASPGVLRVAAVLIEPPGTLKRLNPGPELCSYIVNYAQVSSEARRLIFNHSGLFDAEEVVGSILAALKNLPSKVVLGGMAWDAGCAEAADLLYLLARFKKYEGLSARIIEYTLSQTLKLVWRESFLSRSGKDQNPELTGEALCFCAGLLRVLREASPVLYREALPHILLDKRTLAHLSFAQNAAPELTLIRDLLQEDAILPDTQQCLIAVLGQPYAPRAQLSLNGVFNLALQLLTGSHLTTNEIIEQQRKQIEGQTDFDSTRIEGATTNLFAFADHQQPLNGDLLAANPQLNRLAQISAGIARKDLIYELSPELLKAYGDQDHPTDVPSALSYEPLYRLCVEKMREVFTVVLWNDFCGDDGAEIVVDSVGNARGSWSYVYSRAQIFQLSDFYHLSYLLLRQMVLENPLLIADAHLKEAAKLLGESVAKLGRFVGFLRANHSVFLGGEEESAWLKVFPTILEARAALPGELEAIALGFQVARFKGVSF